MANVANKYAKALFDVAIDKDRLDLMYDELSEVSEATKKLWWRFKSNWLKSKPTSFWRRKFVGIVFGDANYYLKNMLMILANNRHLVLINSIFKEFKSLYNEYHNEDSAIVESVYQLSDEELDRIKDLILKQTNLSQVHITTKINPELIGGFRVKVGTTVLDGSVKKDLEQIERKFRRVN